MAALHAACRTNYGLDYEDCATVANIMLRNLIDQKEWRDIEGRDFGLVSDEADAAVCAACSNIREYWRRGGNLGDPETIRIATEAMSQLPDWMFE